MIKKLKDNKFIIGLFLFAFILRVIVILVVDTPIISDFKTMYEAALEIVKGTSDYKDSLYFLTWGYQMGHVLYQSILLSIINSVVFLKIMNALISSLTIVFLYLIMKRVVNIKIAKISSIFYSIFLFPLLLNTVLTNQFLPLLLILIAIYLFISIDKGKYLLKTIIIGLLLGISNILRSEGIVIITALLLYSFYLIIRKVNIKKTIITFILIACSYMAIFNITSYALMKTDISPNGLKNMNPTWKFVLGFNYETSGMYSSSDAEIYATDQDKAKEIVKERLSEWEKIPVLFLKKIKILWFNSDLSWSLGYLENKTLVSILTVINQIFIIILDLLALLSVPLLFKKNRSNIQVLITLILFVYFGVYLLIEVMPRYAYPLQAFMLILASISLNYIYEKVKIGSKRKKIGK